MRPNTWLLKIASFGAIDRQQERDDEVSQFVDAHGEEELTAQLSNLNFNSEKISESTKNYVLN